jgi:hypothetical protein
MKPDPSALERLRAHASQLERATPAISANEVRASAAAGARSRRGWRGARVVVAATVATIIIGVGAVAVSFVLRSVQDRPQSVGGGPATTTPTTAAGPDTRAPFVFNLATVHGCIGPNQTTTTALASVVDPAPGRLATVELVFLDARGTETHRPMTRAGGGYEGPIGPYEVDGNITWKVVATDEAGNSSSASGPPVVALPSC